mmetsp:Transcript_38616/g.123781  ORF Transcript_38616/g.123781 Transcript_38616/m.123781 type:complete len:389 (-) Transcript_38616:51-1217(-)
MPDMVDDAAFDVRSTESVRRLRDSLCASSSSSLPRRLDVGGLCVNLVEGDDEKLARASAQCLANLAAAGLEEAVWSSLVGYVPEALKRWRRSTTKSDATRAGVIAAVHNCCRLDDARSLAIAKSGAVVSSLLEGCWHVAHDETETQCKSDEWTYLLVCVLLRRGAASAFFATFGADAAGLELVRDAVETEDDGVFCAADDVAVAAFRVAAATQRGVRAAAKDLREKALTLAGDAAGLGPARRAVALREAGAIKTSFLDEFPIAALKIIANVCYFDPRARDDAFDIIPLVLAKCTVNPDAPLQREWAIFAIRNLCADNERNQHFIEGLKPQALNTDAATLKSFGIQSARLATNPDSGKSEVKVAMVRPPSKQGHPNPPPPPDFPPEEDV